MKNKKLLDAMALADEKYVEEADPTRVVTKKPRLRLLSVTAACLCLVLLAGTLALFVPFNNDPANISMYKGSEYYAAIRQLNLLKYEEPKYKNNFEKLSASLSSFFALAVGNKSVSDEVDLYDMDFKGEESIETARPPADAIGSYTEITDNQVDGVIEADRIKRSDRYIYYLDGATLKIYSIAGESSAMVASFDIYDGQKGYQSENWELYLSEDCRTVTVMTTYMDGEKLCTGLVALDVSDPENICEGGSFAITGNYITSRSVDGKLLLVTEFAFDKDSMDFDDPETFVPMIDTGNGLELISPDDIMIPDEVNSSRYTVAILLDERTLDVYAEAAHLSYTDDAYVTGDSLYLVRVFSDEIEGEDAPYGTMTEIVCLRFTDGTFAKGGSVTVRGYIKDQWSMDEYNGVLRIVTTTNSLSEFHLNGGSYQPVSGDVLQSAAGGSSASLYCVDLNTWEIVAAVEKFAPEYEEVQSVRFDGDAAYVCTSIEMSDPVFFFDLSDLENITYKDTGTIEGYSSSLVNFKNGYLLGIGQGDWETFKVEVYEETDSGVRSVAVYEKECAYYSREYKSYLIDRENQMIGLGLCSYGYYDNEDNQYLLLYFNGYDLMEIALVPLAGEPEFQRGVVIEGYLYAFGDNCFAVENVSQYVKH